MDEKRMIPDDPGDPREEARRWVRRKRIFYTVVGIYLSLSIMWFAIDLLDDSSGYWFYWPMLGTGLGVLVTGIVLGGLGGLFGRDWERRQVEKYLGEQADREADPMNAHSLVGVAIRRGGDGELQIRHHRLGRRRAWVSGRPRRRWPRRLAGGIAAVVLLVLAVYGWAWVSLDRSSIARAMVDRGGRRGSVPVPGSHDPGRR